MDWKTVGSYELEKRQNRGKTIVDICERNKLDITNIWLKKPKRRFYTCNHQEIDDDTSWTT